MRLLVFATILASWLPAVAASFKVPPPPASFVTDNAGALSSETRNSLDAKLKAYEKATGHQVIVWIGDTTGDVPLETFTGESAHQWRVGRSGYDDGAILFLFMNDHKIRIEVGYGLESKLTDADADRIIRHVIMPRMKAGKVDDAVASGVAAMLTTISPSYAGATTPAQAVESSSSPSGFAIAAIAIIAVILMCGIIAFALRTIRRGRYGVLVTRDGKKKAGVEMKSSPVWSAVAAASSGGSSSSFDSDSGGSDFSGGGGDFGGGGASGSW